VEKTPFLSLITRCIEYAQTRPSPQNIKLWVTGHSLGAALASMFCLILASVEPVSKHDKDKETKMNLAQILRDRPAEIEKSSKYKVRYLSDRLTGLCTFGNPQIGDAQATHIVEEFLKNKKVQYARVRNGNDVVSTIPFVAPLVSELGKALRQSLRPKGAIRSVHLALDYAAIGDEYRIGLDGRSQPNRSDHYVLYGYHMLRNNTLALLSLPSALASGVSSTAELGRAAIQSALCLLSGGWLCLIFDHAPSEYAKNLDKALALQRAPDARCTERPAGRGE
jgi:hypothetical protein